MKYIITGSLGHISLPVVKNLVAAGHHVTVVSSNADKTKAIEALGAQAAVGLVSDAAFINKTFQGADAVYLMIPPNFATTDLLQYQKEVADIYTQAIELNKVKNVVQLSSIGAHMRNGAGPIDGVAYLEEKLNQLSNTNIKMLRPSYFFYNLFNMIPLIKNANIMGSNFGNTDEKLVLTHTSDIADAVSHHLLNLNFTGASIQYVASDECSVADIATALSSAANKPNTPWITFSDADSLNGMLQAGLPETIANGYVQMGKSIREGLIQADYWKNKPQLGKVKLADFAKEFTAAYNA
ncbi:MAG: NAD(P)H-binding protein [Bacteroidota bacterium]